MPGKNWLAVTLLTLSFIGAEDPYARAQASEGKAPTAADRRETAGWPRYNYGATIFRYPPGWKVEPILWQSAAAEIAGEAPTEVGLTITHKGEPRDDITYGGRGAIACDNSQSAKCKCLNIYDAISTCSKDPQVRHIYDLLVSTISNRGPNRYFTVISPAAQNALRPGQHYTIRWRTKQGVPHHRVEIAVRDTSKADMREAMVLEVNDVPNTGRYDWLVPASITSPGPYLLEIFFTVPQKVRPPALSGGRIYSGTSSPFYIQ